MSHIILSLQIKDEDMVLFNHEIHDPNSWNLRSASELKKMLKEEIDDIEESQIVELINGRIIEMYDRKCACGVVYKTENKHETVLSCNKCWEEFLTWQRSKETD